MSASILITVVRKLLRAIQGRIAMTMASKNLALFFDLPNRVHRVGGGKFLLGTEGEGSQEYI